MSDKGEAQVCPECGWEEGTPPELPAQLAPRTVVSDKYLIGKVLGQGGFGITYLAWDLHIDRKLAIKEYFPRELCSRARDDRTVQPLSQRSRDDFSYGLTKFVEEGRALARFRDYPGIVSLLDFFEANGTAYIVMTYMEGMTFKQYLESQGGKISFDQALGILNPVMDALREVHRAGMLHRDISPDNIYLNRDRQVKILDFGSTRYEMREQSQHLTVLFKPGYAPLEQYSSGGGQGPWTDVYAVGATFYRALTAKPPLDAPDRLAQDDLLPPSRLGVNIPAESEKALLKALAVHRENRFQTIADFQASITPKSPKVVPDIRPAPGPRSWNPVLLVAACLLFLTTLIFALLWFSARDQIKVPGDGSSELLARQNEIASLKSNLDARTMERDNLQARLLALSESAGTDKTRGASQKQENDSLKSTIADLQRQLNAQQDSQKRETGKTNEVTKPPQQLNAPPLRVVYFDLFSWDPQGQKRTGPAVRFPGKSLHYLLCAIGGPNSLQGSQSLSGAVEVRLIAPNQALKYKVTLPVKASKSEGVWSTQTAWGDDKPGNFDYGNWRVEIWSEGHKIADKQFQID